MRPSPLLSGIIYIALGVIFTIIAIQDVQTNGEWGILDLPVCADCHF